MAILETWIKRQPNTDLFLTWVKYISALRRKMSQEDVATLRQEITSRAASIAEASGGMMGIGRTSPAEKATLKKIEEAFSG